MKKILHSFKWFSLVSIMALLLLAPASSVSATAFTVDSNGDAGDASPGNGVCATATGACTLRAAIQEANALSGTDSITIPAMTIVLGSPLTVTQSVNISGAGEGRTIIDGNNATRVFVFQDNSGTQSVSSLTIRNANYVYTGPNPSVNGGGGIFNEANLTLSNVTLSNNRANQGGGVFNAYANGPSDPNPPSLILNSVTLSGNTATSTTIGQGGGGLFNGSLLTANGATISGNTAYQGGGYYNNSYFAATLTNFTTSSNSAKYGGGIDNDLGTITLNTGTISGNTANCCGPGGSTDYTGGAGIYNNEGTITLTNVTLSGNSSTSAGGYGGGIYNFRTMYLTGVTINSNSAAYGAGVYTGNYAAMPSSMTITNTTVSGNIGVSNPSPRIDAEGAGIWNNNSSTLTLINTTVTNNSAVVAGGLENRPGAVSATLRNTIVAGNMATVSSPDCKGVISTSGNNLIENTSGCTFTPGSGDLTNVSARLGSLQNNGGPTFTHALLSGSPAINAVLSGCPPPSVDQRGITRAQGVRCDMGAFEVRPGIDDVAGPVFLPLILKNHP